MPHRECSGQRLELLPSRRSPIRRSAEFFPYRRSDSLPRLRIRRISRSPSPARSPLGARTRAGKHRPFGRLGMRYLTGTALYDRKGDMTPEQQQLVRESWRRFNPLPRAATVQFYDRLFELDPTVQHLFAGVDMVEQERKLLAMFAQIVDAIDHPETLVISVAALGRRHVHYGVKDG